MKKIGIVLVCILTMVAFLSSASGINRSPKSNDSDKEKKPTESKEVEENKTAKRKLETDTTSEKITRRSEATEKATSKKSEKTKGQFEAKKTRERYDYFIDRNNNGIDDRLERHIRTKNLEKQRVIKERTPVPPEKAPVKVIPSTKTPKKVEATKVNEPKKETKVKKTDERKERDKR